ncbi:MAG: cell division protein FtsZ, partial [Candidatus Limnocylindrales bacterium]
IGRAAGENRAIEAARQAIASPLLEVNITGAQGILFNITGSSNLSLFEVTEAAEEIRAAADPEANIIFGTTFDERLGDEVMITVIATGFDSSRKREQPRREATAAPFEAAAVLRQRPAERDFLSELEHQRTQAADEAASGSIEPSLHDERAERPERQPVPARIERSVGQQPAPVRRTYDEQDLEIPSFLRRK